jgi:hypothetical protein
MEQEKRHSYGHFGVGLFLLIAGVALMLDKFDIFNAGEIWHYWPIIIIAVGLGKLLDARETWEYRKAFTTLFFGSWLFISELHLYGLGYHNSWPILLIGMGISILWKSAYPSHFRFAKDNFHGN